MTSRREFLTHVSAATAAGLLAQIPGRRLWALTADELVPEPDEAFLCELALAAVDATRSAGATFADIRLASGRDVGVTALYHQASVGPGGIRPVRPRLSRTDGYGIRAIVNGAWGFAGGTELTLDAVVETARSAVALARANRPRHRDTLKLAPAERIENGVWATPIERDPLSVPLEEMRDLALGELSAALPMPMKGIRQATLGFHWRRPTTVFASTEGTLIVQRLCQGGEGGAVVADDKDGARIWKFMKDERSGGYGYEAVQASTLTARMREAAERAVAVASAAGEATPVEVGRYDIVLGTSAVASLLGTMAGAVNLERALGYQANGVGTSFAAPPADILGKYQVGSELVTVRADRTQSHGAATVGWDEEGVRPDEFTVIENGVIVDYLTNRQTAVELADWYRSRGRPLRSHGCSRGSANRRPEVRTPNLTLEPGKDTTTLEDLIADTKRGFYVEAGGGSTDQQLLNTRGGASHYHVRSITNGVLGGYVRHFGYQFVTPQFWKGVDGIGSGETAEAMSMHTDSLDPLQPFPDSTVRAVPIRVREVNVPTVPRYW